MDLGHSLSAGHRFAPPVIARVAYVERFLSVSHAHIHGLDSGQHAVHPSLRPPVAKLGELDRGIRAQRLVDKEAEVSEGFRHVTDGAARASDVVDK